MTNNTSFVGNEQVVGYDPWKNPRPDDAPEPEPVDLPSDCECARREVERANMRGKNFRHTLGVIELFAKSGTPRKEIYRRARREYDRNRRMLLSGLVRYERLDETPAIVRIAPLASPSRRAVVRPSGHAPRSARRVARTATRNSPGSSDSSDGGPDSSDSSDGPASLPLIGGFRNNNNPRKENNSKKQRKQTIVELSNRLELGSAALMFAAVVSLVMGWSK